MKALTLTQPWAWRHLRRAILAGAKLVFLNPELRMKDIREWSSGELKPRDGEVGAYIPDPGVYVAIFVEHDKRKVQGAATPEQRKTKEIGRKEAK